MTDSRPTIALSLGSGGARGYAHIGVLEEIEARGWEVVGVAGSSMGALVGGLWAAGGLGAYREWVESMSRRDVLWMMDPAFKGAGAMRADKIMRRISDILGDTRIEDLPIPYTAVATDLLSQSEVWFTSGSLVDAIRASIAIPTVITPVQRDGRLLADGGILNPVPVIPLASVRADATVGVNLAGTFVGGNAAKPPVNADSGPLARLPRLRLPTVHIAEPRLLGMIGDRFWPRGDGGQGGGSQGEGAQDDTERAVAPADEPASMPGPPGASSPEAGDGATQPFDVTTLDVFDRALQTIQNSLQRYRLAGYPPDVMIEIPSDSCGTLDFHRATEMIGVGREEARAAFDAWGGPPRR
ncbi:patatin-like phospholipase family protein [Demequina pelophila]|uniref:patatin-like phospholipase family protein n=1 Tax=Demequina pelophila TaxID=1638984 RepID=UPI00078097A8|nr:patatin-like phospholipase family protein [Demequina pelophila]